MRLLGSIDANRGDPRLGWDTDQFPADIYQATEAMMIVLGMGGFTKGDLKFDAKLRRPFVDTEDLFIRLGDAGANFIFQTQMYLSGNLLH